MCPTNQRLLFHTVLHRSVGVIIPIMPSVSASRVHAGGIVIVVGVVLVAGRCAPVRGRLLSLQASVPGVEEEDEAAGEGAAQPGQDQRRH